MMLLHGSGTTTGGRPGYRSAWVIGRVPRHPDATKILLDTVTVE